MRIKPDCCSIRDPPGVVVSAPGQAGESLLRRHGGARKEQNDMTDSLGPKDQAEAIAQFRAQVIGPLLCRTFDSHGELAAAIRELALEPVRPPGAEVSRTFAASTLERWYYAHRQGGLSALQPQSRASGFAGALSEDQRALLLGVRREYPTVSTALIVRTLEYDGRLPKGLVSEPTVRRLFAAHGLDRQALAVRNGGSERRRWTAPAPNFLWHTDVCHGPALRSDGRSLPLRIHALLDDNSRFIVGIKACATEREIEMLALIVKAFRGYGLPQSIYTDNGPTYVGAALSTACTRLGVALVHAKPHDPQARGKMERFWRTLREQCLDHIDPRSTHHDVQVRLLAWLDGHYHRTPHSSLMGKTPAEAFEVAPRKPVDETLLSEALVARGRRRIRRDGTVQIAGTDFEVAQGFLAGRLVHIGRSFLDPTTPPWVEHEDQRFALTPVDPKKNGSRKRSGSLRQGIDAVAFDPPGALLDEVLGRKAGES